MKRAERAAARARSNAFATELAKELRDLHRESVAHEIALEQQRHAVQARYRRAPRLDELDERRPDWDEANRVQKARR